MLYNTSVDKVPNITSPIQTTLPTRWGKASCNWCRDPQVASVVEKPNQCTKTSVMTRDLKDFVLVFNMAISSESTYPDSSTGGKVGIGVTCCPSFIFKQETWNTGWTFDSGGRSSLYDIRPIFCKTWNGPKYLGESFHLPLEAKDCCLYGCNLKKNPIPNFKWFVLPVFICLKLHSSLCSNQMSLQGVQNNLSLT